MNWNKNYPEELGKSGIHERMGNCVREFPRLGIRGLDGEGVK